jgi:protein-S-isoprenylcysteine O-methyltransferase Ste14
MLTARVNLWENTAMKRYIRILNSYFIVVILYLALLPLIIIYVGRSLNNIIGLSLLPASVYLLAAGIAVSAYGWCWIIWSQVTLTRYGNGHPNEILGYELAPTTRSIVQSGPYKLTRNPMAYGLLVFYFLGLGLLSRIPLILFVFPLACLFEVWYHKKYEEPGLLKRFGENYARYKKTVPILLPFFKRRSASYCDGGGNTSMRGTA